MLKINKKRKIKEEEKSLDFVILNDKPQNNSLKFGHEEIGKTIISIFDHIEEPKTMALYGDWGTGKSSIVEYVDCVLKEKSIPSVIFDVWKYSGDSLRRTFLQSLVKQLKDQKFLEKSFQLDTRVYNGEQITKSSSWGRVMLQVPKDLWSKKWVKTVVIIISVCIAVISTFLFLDSRFNVLWEIWKYIGGTGVFGILLTSITSFFKSTMSERLATFAEAFIPEESKSIVFDKYQDPYEFEREFVRILEEMNTDHLLITFDNIDRVEPHLLIDTLTTIKTFLDPASKSKKVLFLIPCDDQQIKKIIGKYFDGADIATEEYLKKFFNISIEIPTFLQAELQSFTKDKLSETIVQEFSEDDTVAWLITKAFRKSPRQIIQFINQLVARTILISERQEDLPEKYLHDNLSSLVSLMILKQAFPFDFKKFVDNAVNDISVLSEEDMKNYKISEECQTYVKETNQQAPINDIKLLISLRRSDLEKMIPGVEELFINLEDNKFEESKKAFSNLTPLISANLDNFSMLINARVQEITNTTSLRVFISGLLNLLTENNLKLSKTAYEPIYQTLIKKENFLAINIGSNILVDQLFDVNNGANKVLLNRIIWKIDQFAEDEDFKDIDWVLQSIRTIVSNRGIISKEDIPLLQGSFSKVRFLRNTELIDTVLSEPGLSEICLTKAFVKNLVEDSTEGRSEVDIIAYDVKVLNQLSSELIESENIQAILTKITNITRNFNSQPFDPESNLLDHLFTNGSSPLLKNENFKNELIDDPLLAELSTAISRIPLQDNRTALIASGLKLVDLIDPAKATPFLNEANNFADSASINAIKSLHDDYAVSFINIRDRLINRSIVDDTFLKLLSDDNYISNKKDIITLLLSRNIDKALEYIDLLNVKTLPTSVINSLLSRVDVNNPNLSEKIFKTCSDLIGYQDLVSKELYKEKMMLFLAHHDTNVRDLGYAVYNLGKTKKVLTKPTRRQIVKELFDWIQNDSLVPDKYQPNTLEIIMSDISELNKVEKSQVVLFAFDALIRNSMNPGSIALGLTLLDRLDVKYSEYKVNFEDIHLKYLSMSDENLKKILKEGILRIHKGNSKGENAYFEQFRELEVQPS